MNILITNDDGIKASGLFPLINEIKKVGRVLVVVPDRERSAISHSITLSAPIRMQKIRKDVYTIDGTPTDCVNLAVLGAFDRKIDIVISGINRGPNMSEDIIYSGTVAAALEAALAKISAFAISIDALKGKIFYKTAAKFALKLTRLIIKYSLPKGVFLNVNVPNLEKIEGVEITRLGSRTYKDVLIKRTDPVGNPYFWIGGNDGLIWERKKGTDYYVVKNNKISITPLHLDLTNYNFIKTLKKWKLK